MAKQAAGNRPILKSSGELTNPADESVVVDSGAVAYGGVYEVIIVISASAAAQFKVQRRNAANGANVGDEVGLYGVASQSQPYRFYYTLEASERIRLLMDDALTGTVWATVNLMPLM